MTPGIMRAFRAELLSKLSGVETSQPGSVQAVGSGPVEQPQTVTAPQGPAVDASKKTSQAFSQNAVGANTRQRSLRSTVGGKPMNPMRPYTA